MIFNISQANDLRQGRFLVFVMNENDQKCRSDECDGCWKNEILPTAAVNLKDSGERLRQKRFYFTLQKKITYDAYYFAMGLTLVIELGVSICLFIIAYCVASRHDNEIVNGYQNVNENDNVNGIENDIGNVNVNGNEQQPVEENQLEGEQRFLIFLKTTLTPPIPNDHRNQNTNQYFGTLIVLAIFYILPAVQLIWVYQRFYKISGNEDICFFNFRCLHIFWGSPAFNHLFSNIGYIFMGLVFILFVLSNKSNKDKGIFVTMGFSLMVQGVMSGLYHDCPNQISFQFGEFWVNYSNIKFLIFNVICRKVFFLNCRY